MNYEIMRELLKEMSIYANLIANMIVIIGAIPIFFWLKNRSFEKRQKKSKII